MLDTGADLPTVQVLLGHSSIKECSTRLSRARLAATPSPIELLGKAGVRILG